MILKNEMNGVCQVYERPEWSSPTPLLRACGNSTPPIVVSSTNQMYVRMRADGTLARRGFNATYTTGNAAARKFGKGSPYSIAS